MHVNISRIQGEQIMDFLPEIHEHLVFQDKIPGQREAYTKELHAKVLRNAEDILLVVAESDGQLLAFVVAQALPACVFVSQTWSAARNPWQIVDELFLRVILWAEALGKKSIRAETARDADAFFRRFGFVERSVVIERAIEPGMTSVILDGLRSMVNGKSLPEPQTDTTV